MHIHYVCSVNFTVPPTTGFAAHIHNVVNEFRRRGHEVTLFACHESREAPANEDGDMVYVARVPHSLGALVTYSMRYWRCLQTAAARRRPDVIYARFGDWQFVPTVARRIYGSPLVLELNGVPDLDRSLSRPHRHLIRAVMRDATRIVVKSDYMAQHIASSFGVPAESFAVATNGVDVDLYRPRDLDERRLVPADRPVIGYAGLLAGFSGLARLTAMAPEIIRRHPGALFAVAGGGPAEVELATSFAAAGLSAHLLLLGDLDYAAAGRFMSECDVLLYLADDSPRNNMQSPLKLYHYLATGVPTVATDLPVVRQFQPSGLITVPPDAPDRLVDAVAGVLEFDAETRRRVGSAHRRFVLEHHTWAHTVDRLEGLLSDVVKRHSTEGARGWA